MNIKTLADEVKGELYPLGADCEIERINSLDNAGEDDISFLSSKKYFHAFINTKAKAIIVSKTDFSQLKDKRDDIIYLIVEDAYLTISQLLRLFELTPEIQEGISCKANVDSSAEIGENCSVYPGVFIGKDVKIGDNCMIMPNCVIEDKAIIGNDVFLHPSVVIRFRSFIGNRVVIHSGTVIGSDGFGFAPDSDRKFHKIPQIGIVRIEDDVEIGANVTIDRAALGETVIRKGVKLDNLIQVGHNVIIDENTVIAAQTGISGSTYIGKYNMIGGQVGFAGHLKTGDKVMIAAQSGIHKDIADGSIMFGSPARPAELSRRVEAAVNRLPKYLKLIRKIAKELNIPFNL